MGTHVMCLITAHITRIYITKQLVQTVVCFDYLIFLYIVIKPIQISCKIVSINLQNMVSFLILDR